MRKDIFMLLFVCILASVFVSVADETDIELFTKSEKEHQEEVIIGDQEVLIDETELDIEVAIIESSEFDDELSTDEEVELQLEEGETFRDIEQIAKVEPNDNFKDFVIKKGVVTGYKGKGGDITIPSIDSKGNSVTAIGKAAFKGNKRITRVIIPETITKIGAKAFMNCVRLESVVYSNRVKIMGDGVFQNCEVLERIQIID